MGRIRKWTDAEVEYLLDNYGQMLYKDIARHLDTNSNRVKKKLHALKLVKDYTVKEWAEGEIELLRADMNMRNCELAKKYQCTYAEITKQRNKYEKEQVKEVVPEPIKRHKAVYSNPDYTRLAEMYTNI